MNGYEVLWRKSKRHKWVPMTETTSEERRDFMFEYMLSQLRKAEYNEGQVAYRNIIIESGMRDGRLVSRNAQMDKIQEVKE